MNILAQPSSEFKGSIIIPVFEILNNSNFFFEKIEVSNKIFSGKKDSYYVSEKGENIYVFLGLGKESNYLEIKKIFRKLIHKDSDWLQLENTIVFPENFTSEMIEAAIVGTQLGSYQIGHFKSQKKKSIVADENFKIYLKSTYQLDHIIVRANKIAKAQMAVFNLVDLPPNEVDPKYLSDFAVNAGKEYGFDVTVLGLEKIKINRLEAFLAVGKGSEKEPQFIIMQYEPKSKKKNTKHVGLVGKGITFDTGGLNIKTAGMLHMKSDMAGGAAVLGVMQLVADLQLDVVVTAIVPACENAVDNKSFRPSDVISSYAGHSIEIIDTDAEGRLILADGLSYLIKNFNPDIVVDIATLTGSSIGTFGYECAAMFSNNEEIISNLKKSGESIGELVWQLPLWDQYNSDIESSIADVKNYSGKPIAGAISAAKFLEYFTDDHQAWAHLDIAGVAFIDDEFAKTKHSSAYGVYLLTKFIENL